MFTIENDFQHQQLRAPEAEGLKDIHITVKEVRKVMEEQDVTKATGPDGMSNWVIKRCSNQLAEKNSWSNCELPNRRESTQ